MIRFISLAFILALTACSSSKTTVTTGGKTIGELRAACHQGQRSACSTVKAHDGLL